MDNNKIARFGTLTKKVMIILLGGIAMGLSGNPKTHTKLRRDIQKELRLIDERNLNQAIEKLYQSKLIDYKENSDGTVSLWLTNNGKKKALQFNLDTMRLKRFSRWDRLWRVVIFDIPENLKNGRDSLARKIIELGFYPLQKSVFIYPYECRDEIDFIVEIFNLKPYVRFLIVKKIDVELYLKKYFKLH